ncbi:damage-control phosphatase ARMT1 family protein [Helicobacter pametensis]|uniref:damage-control phosphatase ARMT1 family protein n=1 Tax=Helicobacter pametensis TaxID=95149 RepID=UPI0004860828|nr:ARMT1-like domain-containing protein [Helicobacter pametensis]
MKAQQECFTCLQNQVMAKGVPLAWYQQRLDLIPKDSKGASLDLTPPQIAIDLYAKMACDLGVSDPFAEIKRHSIHKAHQMLEGLEWRDLDLQEALRLSAFGNVIDYGSASQFCIHDFDFAQEFKKLDFACFELEAFITKLQEARIFVMLGDNAGENLFDEILLRVLSRDFPQLVLYYFVRGGPIINDITLKDLREYKQCAGIFEVASVVDSGVRSPGFVYEDASLEARRLFDEADVILSKGMGNFECLNERTDKRVMYLLKIKCQVVAHCLNLPLGKMVFR